MSELKIDGSEGFIGTCFGEIMYHVKAIEKYMKTADASSFANDMMLQDAIMIRLQSIGGVLKNITGRTGKDDPFGILAAYPEVEWREIKGMRDIIAHDYCGVDISYPWEAITDSIPKMKEAIIDICEKYPDIMAASKFALQNISYKIDDNRNEFMESFENDPDLKFLP